MEMDEQEQNVMVEWSLNMANVEDQSNCISYEFWAVQMNQYLQLDTLMKET